MFLEMTKSKKGVKYLRLVRSVATTDKNGKTTSIKEIILSLGDIAQYDDGKPEYFKRLKKSFEDGDPLIEELRPYVQGELEYDIKYKKGQEECIDGECKLVSNLILEGMFEEIGVDKVIATSKLARKIKYDVYGFIKLLIFERILRPSNNMDIVRHEQDYFEKIIRGNIKNDNVYEALGFISENKDKIIKRINNKLTILFIQKLSADCRRKLCEKYVIAQ